MQIKIARVLQPVFFRGSNGVKDFYIHVGNTTRMLDSRETQEYNTDAFGSMIFNMHEKDLYPAVEKFLKAQKNCIAKYVGTELSLKRGRASLRIDVFRVSNDDENPHKNRP